MTVKQQLSV